MRRWAILYRDGGIIIVDNNNDNFPSAKECGRRGPHSTAIGQHTAGAPRTIQSTVCDERRSMRTILSAAQAVRRQAVCAARDCVWRVASPSHLLVRRSLCAPPPPPPQQQQQTLLENKPRPPTPPPPLSRADNKISRSRRGNLRRRLNPIVANEINTPSVTLAHEQRPLAFLAAATLLWPRLYRAACAKAALRPPPQLRPRPQASRHQRPTSCAEHEGPNCRREAPSRRELVAGQVGAVGSLWPILGAT